MELSGLAEAGGKRRLTGLAGWLGRLDLRSAVQESSYGHRESAGDNAIKWRDQHGADGLEIGKV